MGRLREQAHRYNPAIEAAPVAILWTDERREWEPCLDLLRDALPELHALGPYAPEARTGPGVWLRMVADRQAGSAESGGIPILYLPGVGNAALRTDLRGIKDDPQLAPIAELQYRGVFWRQDNGKDWTLRAFLESERGGLGLRVSGDQETLQALKVPSASSSPRAWRVCTGADHRRRGPQPSAEPRAGRGRAHVAHRSGNPSA